ncbi:hypothetical protein B0T18DRAFT_454601 [Schizothecium vesticola]|uniref:SH3 domain-containing protein n=1 Tax=Schizothecium vesticola TaxID=314040 RepID=A0AA40FB58_9PEZI|nr:hypothetical protein B0T18DRAFT_454601 [Schizothecium vesticola]
MVLVPPPLPTRFPCWVRAVYSWGGESKRDLGFIEGDLIECLNAGDGSWWTGRLFRDRRAVGVFPSNFVEVLPDTFRPTTRSTSPLPASGTPSPQTKPQKSKTFRKPFEAYSKAPHYTTAKIPETYRDPPVRARESLTDSVRNNSVGSVRPPSPSPPPAPTHVSRAVSPAPSFRRPSHDSPAPLQHSRNRRASSPAPPRLPQSYSYDARAPSPAPPQHYQPGYDPRAPSPAPLQHSQSRGYDPRAPSPAPLQHSHSRGYDPRAPSPAPPLQHIHSRGYDPRAASPMPIPHSHGYDYGDRAPSPAPPPMSQSFAARGASPAPPHLTQTYSYDARAPSPAPSFIPQSHGHGSRAPSPAPSYRPYRPPGSQERESSMDRQVDRQDSPPPPPPPPHRSTTLRQGSNASYEQAGNISRQHSNTSFNQQATGYHTPRNLSPCPPSPGGGEGFTPSPLREAMDDVMEQLDALGVSRETASPEPPFDPWSPDSFQRLHEQSRKKRQNPRPMTSMGLASQVDEGYETHSGTGNSSRDATCQDVFKQDKPQPELSNYVERMESKLRTMQHHNASVMDLGSAPTPPPKGLIDRPKSSMDVRASPGKLHHKKSAYEVGRQVLERTFTTKTTSTNSSSATQSTNRSLMSGSSAGAISATSAGSLARKNMVRAQSAFGMRDIDLDRPETPFTGVTYHSSHASGDPRSKSQIGFHDDAIGGLGGVGGLVQPKPKKQNFIKRILESAKTGVASTRGSIATAGAGAMPGVGPQLPSSSVMLSGMPGQLSPSKAGRDAAREMGLGSGVDWVQVRRDVNRSNSLSRNERVERKERCQMLDYPALDPVDELYNCMDGDEGADGMPVAEPTNYQAINFSQVDKNSRFINNLPPSTTAIALATGYICRPYRSDVQRLRAIFSWVAETIAWEEDFEGEVDTRRVLQAKRGCAEEYAVLVLEMCAAVGLTCEVVRGYLKAPGEIPEANMVPRSNHWWNAVLVDNEWRMMDTCLASPSNPRRLQYSSSSTSTADPWWFLTRPTELCWTHIPEHHSQQHICPPVAHEVLLNLPCACPPYFRNALHLTDYNTSLTRIEDLEMVHVKFNVPADVEVAAEVEVRAYSRDSDGDFFESGDVVKKRALAQAEWFGGVKRYTIKALLPGDEGTGTLKVYAGKRGLMHSIKDIPHPLAFALPIIHSGENPVYEFVTRHPTPHAQRHDIYIVQPQCQRLALNNTFVFAVRQHPSSLGAGPAAPSSAGGGASPIPFVRPGSAMSMVSSAQGSNPSSTASSSAAKKPAKLAIQTPGGKILRLMRKEERRGVNVAGRGTSSHGGLGEDPSDGGMWETIIKCSERGVWRGLVLADRTARWCVFAEWVCQ